MNYDEYGEVINGEKTYKTIAENLKDGQSVLIGWTDEEFTHYDVLLHYTVNFYGKNIQHGIRPYYLYVSIIGIGAMGFRPDTEKSIDYIQQKLRMTLGCTKLTELINGIIGELNNANI